MPKSIVAVGFDVPGGEVESIDLLSDRSLLDFDIVLFRPSIPYMPNSSSYQGKTCLSDQASFEVREMLSHWKRELSQALEAGKLVIVILGSPEAVFAATGETRSSGTGRNAATTRIVSEIKSYAAMPLPWGYAPATGTEMVLSGDSRFVSSYWAEFGKHSQYRLYLDAPDAKPLLKTRSGGRVVGAYVSTGRGALVALPELDVDDEAFSEEREVNGKPEAYWSESGCQFGKRLVAIVSAMADSLSSEVALSPRPEWASLDTYHLPAEARLASDIERARRAIEKAEAKRVGLEMELQEAGELRYLLYEQGKPLEHAVRKALQIMGFEANQYTGGDSEFDVVFTSKEGRFIGEVEGKDTKAINIDKFSQLERNINEDFARDEVTDYAKGVLFGNAYRLKPPVERPPAFTEKCMTASDRLRAALVRTEDLFAPCQYLTQKKDAVFAAACRAAILTTCGVVAFPDIPVSGS